MNALQLITKGDRWRVVDLTTTAGIVAPPTTTAGLTLQNPAASGKSYVLYGIPWIVDVMPATEESLTIWLCAHKLPVGAFTRDITLAVTGAGAISGYKAGEAYPGQVILDRGATVVDDGWSPVKDSHVGQVASNVDWGGYAELAAPVIVPAGLHVSLAVLISEATIQVGLGFDWAEVPSNKLGELV